MFTWFSKSSRTKPYAWIAVFAPCAGILPFLVYTLTVSRTVYPGQSAYLTAVAAGLENHTALTHPLFTQLMHAVAQIPLGTIAVRLNVTCCLFAALAAMLFYRFVARLIYLLAHENPSGMAHIFWDAADEETHPTNDGEEESDIDDDDVQPRANPLTLAEIEQQHQRTVR